MMKPVLLLLFSFILCAQDLPLCDLTSEPLETGLTARSATICKVENGWQIDYPAWKPGEEEWPAIILDSGKGLLNNVIAGLSQVFDGDFVYGMHFEHLIERLNDCPFSKISHDIFLFQILRIKSFKFRKYEDTVFPDKNIIEPDLSAAVLRSLDHYEIPVICGLVAVRSVLVAHPRRQME